MSAREHIVRPLQTMTNLLAALREGDYSIRARGARVDDALGEVLLEINALGETLRTQRLGAFEATALLRTIMAEIDVSVFTFDPDRRLRLVNRAGEILLGQPIDKLLGRRAKDLGLEACLDANEDAPLTLTFPGGSGRWGVRRSSFRERGLPHELMVLTDLSRTLREEERNAWQRLVRVLGHEMNNSLAPIKSIAGSLETLLRRDPPPPDWQDDARSGSTSSPRAPKRLAALCRPTRDWRACHLRKRKRSILKNSLGEQPAWRRGWQCKVRQGPRCPDAGRCRAARAVADQHSAQCGRCFV